jgi:3-isopropylmalate/(R)-2-methylmalate dehydratase small subunit
MEKFTTLTGNVAYLPIDNIDTDMIIPKQFLKTIARTGLGKNLFFEMRNINGIYQENFILNKITDAKILITGDNFGCGSSREHAPWALLDFGITCVIAESFADIFYNNCFENGILPICLNKELIKELSNHKTLSIDLPNQTINGDVKFEIEEFKKNRLLSGLDSIGITEQYSPLIKDFESKQKEKFSWLW